MDIPESLLVSGRLIRKKYRFRNLHHSVAGTSCVAAKSDRENKARSLIFGNNSFVSFFRGLKYSYDETINGRSYSTSPFLKNKHFTDVQAPGFLDLPDSVFFDSETGKELLQNDQVFHESSFVQEKYTNECRSEDSKHRMSAPSILIDSSKIIKECSAVSEFPEAISLPINQKKQNCSKPFPYIQLPYRKYRNEKLSVSSFLDPSVSPNTPLLSFDIERNGHLCMDKPKTALMFSTPKWTSSHTGFNYHENLHCSTNEKRLEENLLHIDNPFSLIEVDETVSMQSNSGSSATGSGFAMHRLSSGIRSCNEQWSIEPQLVILNPSKGNRVRLLNNTARNLRFKTVFDFKLTHISPLSGTVPAMNEIGLRIIISPYSRKQNKNFKDEIKVIIGKKEKSIHVQFFRGNKLKSFK